MHDALSALRKENDSITLWIDAICIDQGSEEDKSEQIPLMGGIYTRASAVWVWLGTAVDDSDFVMETLAGRREDHYKTSRFMLGLVNLLRRPWWTRTWIVQEYVLHKSSPQLFCGGGLGVSSDLVLDIFSRIPTTQLPREFYQTLFQRRIDLSTLGSRSQLRTLRESRHGSEGEYLARDLRNALYWLKNFEVTKSEDKVYGILGLVDAATREQFIRNFGVDTNKVAGKIYHDAAIFLLKSESSSTFLCDFPLGQQSESGIPSWVPKFDVKDVSYPISPVRLVNVTSSHLNAPREDVEISKDRLHLSVRGIIVGQVADVLQVEDRPFMTLNFNERVQNVLNILGLAHRIRQKLEQLTSHEKKRSPFEPLWRTLIAGNYGSIINADLEDGTACEKQFDEWMAIPGNQYPQNIMTIVQKMSEKPNIIHKIGLTLSPGRCFFTGEQGAYGISEPGTRKDDILALLFHRHYVPVVLRRKGDFFEMVSAAYIPERSREAFLKDNVQNLRKLVIV